MAYTKQTWQTGDVVTAQKLNNMENGIADAGVLVIGFTEADNKLTMDKTWQEIYDAMTAGKIALAVFANSEELYVNYTFILTVRGYDNTYTVDVFPDYGGTGTIETYTCASADGYPYLDLS